ncbi:(Fe-S)-binding protein [Methylomonas sp. SURF-2]|uniref:(Fe-S)-binding protein n=1 Tax=Methylomonas subterranea TaxID=2952225 RepID=A0ABT1TIG0_9GAMM|nr:(Fe-S)-binding protein [Methylomonas sp. SURF-2]MCQ8105265.1 (Fe-S)-binding protein [Methylomonas sp. SURF-2]
MKLFLDWSSYENAGMGDAYADIPKHGADFAKAVAVCIGSRQCEQSGKGVMCPSYRISGNPVLSPGGRVKLLKSALNAGDEQAFLNPDPELAEAMDLCLSCKGCKRECENEVDMALIKAEFLAQQVAQHGMSLRRRLWSELPKILCWPVARPLLLWRNGSAWLARALEVALGIGAKVRLPVPARQPFQYGSPAKDTVSVGPVDKQVVLFVDTFNHYFNPAAAEAAQKLLKAGGYQVHIARPRPDDEPSRPLCCGRTYFSNGRPDRAAREARRLLKALEPHVRAGRSIVGLEPSCILNLRDEYLKLGLGEAAQKLAEKVLLLEEFIVREQSAGRWTLHFQALPDVSRLLLHGHCHQKAVGAIKSVRKLLKQVPGLDFELIEASCCGMAGNFGVEAEHVEHARAMAELALFPALRAEPAALLVSNGFSCQQQISNGGFARPLHLSQLLCMALPASE